MIIALMEIKIEIQVFVTLLVFSTDKINKRKKKWMIKKKLLVVKAIKNCINNNCASKLFKLLSFVVVALAGSSYNSLNPSPAELIQTIFFFIIYLYMKMKIEIKFPRKI